MNDYYRLNDDHTVTKVDLMEWAENMETENTRVACTDLGDGRHIATVFLGLDHRWYRPGPPLIFETTMYGGEDDYLVRYSTYEQALRGHQQTVESFTDVGGGVP